MTNSAACFGVVLLCAAILAVEAGHDTKGDADLVSRTCANATRDFCRVRITKDDCVSTLRSDNRSAAAKDPRDLALVAIDLLRLSAARADAKVDAVLRAGPGGATKGRRYLERCLQYCRLDYDAVARNIPVCRAMIEQYSKPGARDPFWYYFECMDRLLDPARDCKEQATLEDDEEEVIKAVGKEVDEVVQRATLARAVLGEMF